jgi:hypothetical protein
MRLPSESLRVMLRVMPRLTLRLPARIALLS